VSDLGYLVCCAIAEPNTAWKDVTPRSPKAVDQFQAPHFDTLSSHASFAEVPGSKKLGAQLRAGSMDPGNVTLKASREGVEHRKESAMLSSASQVG
jgi:hypothetical protein